MMVVKEYVFTKKDGTIRTLKGTNSYYEFTKKYPERWLEIEPKSLVTRSRSDKTITLIDLDLMEWRSIRTSSIISERIVKDTKLQFSFKDNDGYYRRSLDNFNYIKRNKVPYYVLMVINSKNNINRNEIEIEVDFILASINRDLRVRGKRIRAISRAIRLFKINNFIDQNNDGSYIITNKGIKLLETSII